jgi:hypothetical protein
LVEKREGDHMQGIGGKTILRFMLRTWGGGHRLDWYGPGQGQAMGTCKCGNEPSGSVKCRGFLD